MIKRLCWNIIEESGKNIKDNSEYSSDSETDETIVEELSNIYRRESLASLFGNDESSAAEDLLPSRKDKRKELETENATEKKPKKSKKNTDKVQPSNNRTPTKSTLSDSIQSVPMSAGEIYPEKYYSYEQGIIYKEKKRGNVSFESEEKGKILSSVRTCLYCKNILLLNDADVMLHIQSKKHKKALAKVNGK